MPSLPAYLSSFVGRDAEIARITDLLSSTRLLTLTGPGGVGKTRLALAVAESVAGSFRDGVAFVPLTPVTDPALAGTAIEAALGLAERGGRAPGETLAAHLADREMLLVLDNFEQIVEAAPLIADLLHAAPRLTVLVTSRVTLRVSGEQEVSVQPLALPDPDRPPPIEQLRAYEAIALFGQRAREGQLDFEITAQNGSVVEEICRRLDGLPLAIELAAARIKLLSPAALLERLDRRLPLLTGGARNLPARQQTMRDTIAWSYDLLDAADQRLFRQLSVFSGGWTLEAAEEICQVDADGPDVFDGLASLADKSLLRRIMPIEQLGAGRFALLETVREYGLEKLDQSTEATLIHDRHAMYFAALAERVDPHLHGPDPAPWLSVLDTEHGNLLTALDWLLRREDTERGARMVGALREYWYMRGRSSEGVARAAAFLKLPAMSVAGSARAHALETESWLTHWLGNSARSIALGTEALAIWDDLGDRARSAQLYNSLGLAAQEVLDMVQAQEYWVRGLALARETSDTQTLARLLANVGHAAHVLGDLDVAAKHLTEALAVAEANGHKEITGLVKHILGRLEWQYGNHRRATELFRESLELYQDVGNTWGVARAVGKLAIMAQTVGHDAPRAARLFGA
ncbi:MAG TPA: tetratricopeptide repeat protein, partial [Thermomicrobiales bacterium]|nr:tetratricopeptide repeat protein [Thermomicrobiales bacterium]